MYFIHIGHPEVAILKKSFLEAPVVIFWAISATGIQSGNMPACNQRTEHFRRAARLRRIADGLKGSGQAQRQRKPSREAGELGSYFGRRTNQTERPARWKVKLQCASSVVREEGLLPFLIRSAA